MHEVIIVGGGAAGLNAALVLGRARRRVLVVDAGHPRNERVAAAHGIFTRDGTPPDELLRAARAELRPYRTVELRSASAVAASVEPDRFAVSMTDGSIESGRRLLLAYGITDRLPEVDGVDRFWGNGLFHCPHCDGWEHRDRTLGVWADGTEAVELVQGLLAWSRDLVVLTGGPSRLTREDRHRLQSHGVRIVETTIHRLEGRDRLERVVLVDGSVIEAAAVFLKPEPGQGSDLASQLGCELTEGGIIQVGIDSQTSVPGVYAAGDAASKLHQVVLAAASGATAAIMINSDLAREDFVIGAARQSSSPSTSSGSSPEHRAPAR